jgi:hypothetical protein
MVARNDTASGLRARLESTSTHFCKSIIGSKVEIEPRSFQTATDYLPVCPRPQRVPDVSQTRKASVDTQPTSTLGWSSTEQVRSDMCKDATEQINKTTVFLWNIM